MINFGWFTEDGTEVTRIPVGTAEDIVLVPHLTSRRNLARPVSLSQALVMEDLENGVILFAYELGAIENVPLIEEPLWSIESLAGLEQQKSETYTRTI